MQKSVIGGVCPNGHYITQLCFTQKCSQSALICDNYDCQYSSLHNSCLMKIKANQILQSLLNLSEAASKRFEFNVIQRLNNIIQRLESQKHQLLNIFANPQIRLKGQQRDLLDILLNKSTKQIKSSSVLQIIKQIQNKQKNLEENGFRLVFLKMAKQISGVLNQIKEKLDIEVQNFRFDSQLANRQLLQISQKNTVIKRVSEASYESYSLISPSLSDAIYEKIRLKPLSFSDRIYVGLADKNLLTSSKFRYPKEGEGLYIISDIGYVHNFMDKENNHKKFDFAFNKGDTIELEYLFEEKQLRITNVSNKQSFKLFNVDDEGKEYHYCVYTRYNDDSWEIIRDTNKHQ